MEGPPRDRRGALHSSLSLRTGAAIASLDGRIVWTGPSARAFGEVELVTGGVERSAGGRLVTPGFVDSHTHPLFAVTREAEFALRAEGADYEEIAAAGGGILSSVEATRAAADATIEENLVNHLGTMLLLGTTTVEAKSGYGLDRETELRCLRVARDVSAGWPQTIVRTFLGAHEVPTEYRDDPDGYLDMLVSEVLPSVGEEDLAEFVDIFCEKGVFTPEQTERYLRAASDMGFRLKLHADELHDTGGAGVAVNVGAVSADHLLRVSKENARRLAGSAVVATLLPGTALFLGKQFPPGRELVDAGAAVALATDFNPGSCFCESMPFMVNLAVCACGLTVEEALVAATVNGAAAVGLAGSKGSLSPGMDADMVLWDLDDYRGIAYHMAVPDIEEVFCGGRPVSGMFRGPGRPAADSSGQGSRQ